MWGWISRCWGGIGVTSQFERARIRSVIADWQVPDDTDICGTHLPTKSSSILSKAPIQRFNLKLPLTCFFLTWRCHKKRVTLSSS